MRQILLSIVLFCALPLLASKPMDPTNLLLDSTAHSVSLSWSDSDDKEQGFKIFRDGVLIHITNEDATSYVDRSVSPNTFYEYTVVATDIARYKLQVPEGNQIYFGSEAGYTEDTTDANLIASKIREFDRLAVKKTMWAYLSDNWIQWEDRGNNPYPKSQIAAILNENKKVVFMRMMPYKKNIWSVDPMSAAQARACRNDKSCINETYTLNSIATNSSVQDKIRKWAQGAKDHFDEQKRLGKAFYLLLDFAPEMNGYWFPWGGAIQSLNDDNDKNYKDAYRKIIEIFREVKVPHVTWVFHPSLPNQGDWDWLHDTNISTGVGIVGAATWARPSNFYPGDEYIDWIGFSRYGKDGAMSNQDDYASFSEKMDRFDLITEIDADKPIMVAEFAVRENPFMNRGQDKALWLEAAFRRILSEPRIRAISYWNETWDDFEDLNYPELKMHINSSPQSLKAFKEGVANPRFINQSVISYENR